MMRLLRFNGVAALHLAVSSLLLAGCGKAHHESRAVQGASLPPARVRTMDVKSETVPAIEEVVGTVRARLRATIEAKATGRIVDMPVVLGQKVKAGDLLARLDAPEIKARLDQAEATLSQGERDWKRTSALFKQGATTQAELDAANSRYLVAKGALAEARAMLGYVEVLAAFDGVVTKKWVDMGDLAAPGKPLVDIEDPSRMQVEVDVPEAIASRVTQNARLTLRTGQGEATNVATVSEIAPVADPNSRTVRVKLDLPSGPGLKSGQFARLLVPVGEITTLRVPSSAVVQRGQMEIVFAAENQQAQLRLVRTGRRGADQTEILAGLKAGDLVVVDNVTELVDGQPLQSN